MLMNISIVKSILIVCITLVGAGGALIVYNVYFTQEIEQGRDVVFREGVKDIVKEDQEEGFKEKINQGLDPSITILSPNGGEVLEIGKTYEIQWKSCCDEYAVALSVINKSTGEIDLLGTMLPSSGSFEWTVPFGFSRFGSNDLGLGIGEYTIVASLSDKPGTSDESDNYFNIISATEAAQYNSAPTITLLYPNEGEILQVGKPYTVRWRSSNVPEDEVIFVQMKDFGEPFSLPWTLALTNSNNGVREITIPDGIRRSRDTFKFIISTSSGIDVQDESDGFVTIATEFPPKIITSTIKDLEISIGSNFTATWQTTNIPSTNPVTINLRHFDEEIAVAKSTFNDGVEVVTIPTSVTKGYVYSLYLETEVDGVMVYTNSHANITIVD
jgi:hypothetical protein